MLLSNFSLNLRINDFMLHRSFNTTKQSYRINFSNYQIPRSCAWDSCLLRYSSWWRANAIQMTESCQHIGYIKRWKFSFFFLLVNLQSKHPHIFTKYKFHYLILHDTLINIGVINARMNIKKSHYLIKYMRMFLEQRNFHGLCISFNCWAGQQTGNMWQHFQSQSGWKRSARAASTAAGKAVNTMIINIASSRIATNFWPSFSI